MKICPKLKKSHSIFIGEKIHHLEVITIPVKAPTSVYRSWQIDYRTLYRSINVKNSQEYIKNKGELISRYQLFL